MDIETLGWACGKYRDLTSYDSSLRTFRRAIGKSLDVARPEHAAALFKWLNAWQCRQFAVAHHGTATESLNGWATDWLDRLPSNGRQLTDLGDRELNVVALAYDALRGQTASIRNLSVGPTPVTFGPTGAAKILFALRPSIVPPWDDPIRLALGYRRGNAADFRSYLLSVGGQLRDLERSSGIKVAELPSAVGRLDSSPPKLIDEHNWIVITKGLTRAI